MAVSVLEGITVSICGNTVLCMVDGMVFFFLSGNGAVGDGQETDVCWASLLSRACAYRVTPARAKRPGAVSRTAKVAHFQTNVLI